MFSLAKSLIKENKGFTAALIALYALTVGLVVAISIVPATVEASLHDFIIESDRGDCYVYTVPLSRDRATDIASITGIERVFGRNYGDAMVRMSDGKICLMRFISMPEDAFMKLYWCEDGVMSSMPDQAGIAISKRYALFTDVKAGDAVTIQTDNGARETEVIGTVASLESVMGQRDDYAWYEDESFGIIYVAENYYDELFGTQGFCTEWVIDLEEDADTQEVTERLQALLGEDMLPIPIAAEDFAIYQTVRTNLDTLESACTYLPGLVLVVVLGFSVLFIGQIVLRSRAFIGLLKALGYHTRRITGIFLLYIVMPAACGAVIGVGIGVVGAYALTGLYVDQFTLPGIVFACDSLRLAAQLIAIFALAIISTLIACVTLGRIDPAEAYGGMPPQASGSPSRLARLVPCGPFGKVAISLISHSYLRVINCTLCIIAALCLIATGVFLYYSMDASVSTTFEKRLLYDALVDLSESEKDINTIAAMAEVNECEPLTRGYMQVALANANDNSEEAEYVQVNGIDSASDLVMLHDAQGNRIPIPQSGIILDEGLAGRLGVSVGNQVSMNGHLLDVAGVAREFVNPIAYVSLDQARDLGLGEPAVALVTLQEGTDNNSFREAVSIEAPGAYVLILADQRKGMESAMDAINIPILFIISLSIAIGLVIVYNMTELSIAERRREYATLLVLGTGYPRVALLTFAELFIELAIAFVIGCPVGYTAASFVLDQMCSAQIQYPVVQPELAMAVSCLITTVYVVSAAAIAQLRVRRWNLMAVLNSAE